jgi:hypothetical protein
MVEIKEMDLENNEITYAGTMEKVDYSKFQDAFINYWNNRIAGETISPFYMERFMKRSSSKNVSQLLHGKKAEGFLEATTGKKMDPGIVKIIVIMVIVMAGLGIAVWVMHLMGLL